MQIEMTIKGLMIDPITNMPIVILRDGEGQRILPIWVGVFEANAIALALRSGAPIYVEETVIATARSVETSKESMDVGRLQKWLENLSDEELGKYKM